MNAVAENEVGREATFDPNGNAVVTAAAGEDTANIYLTVGDGAEPSDPTAASNDATISGNSGTAETGVHITTGNEAVAKVVAEDADGNLGDVQTVRQRREASGGMR